MMEALRPTALASAVLAVFLLASFPLAQGTAVPASPLMLVSREGRRPVATTLLNGQEAVAVDLLAGLFQFDTREEAAGRRMTITYRGRTIVLTADAPVVSVGGRSVTLASPVVRSGRRWLVPLEFLPRALALVYDARIDLRPTSRLLVLGDARVPRVVGRIDSGGSPSRATIEITPPARVTTVVEPGRVLLQIDADALDLTSVPGGDGLIDQIRLGDQATTVAVVLGGRTAPPRIAETAGGTTTRVTVEVTQAGPVTIPAPASAAAPPPAAPRPGGGDATRSAAGLPTTTIVIDPGHGGEDVGVRGVDGVEEKQVTLDVARRVKSLIEKRLSGARVILTREDDRALGPDARAAVANSAHADIFLSLHANAAPDASLTGAEVFHLGQQADGLAASRTPEPAPIPLTVAGGSSRDIELVEWDVAQARYAEASALLAAVLEENLRQHVTMGTRPVREARLRVLVGATMPAAVVEMAYLTNPEQAGLLVSDSLQSTLAQALSDALVDFSSYLNTPRPRDE